MIEIINPVVFGWDAAIRGMRNPLNSWGKSDSCYCSDESFVGVPYFKIGENDLDLMKRLIKGGTEHRKFLRMIVVVVDINAPCYWWSEYDTYKVGTVANSCSKMHTLHKRNITLADFSHEHLTACNRNLLTLLIKNINEARMMFVANPKSPVAKEDWYQMIQLLPSSYNQKRTVQLNYEVLLTQYRQRKGHKLDEWRQYCDWVESLPYMKEFLEVVK